MARLLHAFGYPRTLVKQAVTSQRSARTAVPSPTLSGCCRSYRAADAPTSGAVGRVGIGLLGVGGRAAAAVALATLVTMLSMPTVCSWNLGRRRDGFRDANARGSGTMESRTLPLVTALFSSGQRIRREATFFRAPRSPSFVGIWTIAGRPGMAEFSVDV